MKLVTKELAKKIPQLYSTEKVATEDKTVVAKFFTPDSSWTWYVVEGSTSPASEDTDTLGPLSQWDGTEDVLFFGFVDGFEGEWGYFTLNELKEARGPLGLAIKRDLYFEPTKFSELKGRNAA